MWQLFSEQQITCIKDKNGLDMLLRENVDIFKMWEARISTDNLKVKIGIQHGLYYITGNAATKWKETFLLQLHYLNSKEMDYFPVLALFKEFLFADASYHINHARQINLWKPETSDTKRS